MRRFTLPETIKEGLINSLAVIPAKAEIQRLLKTMAQRCNLKMASSFTPPLLTFLAACLFVFFPVMAGAVHKGAGNLVCGSCHTMHNGQGGVGMAGASGGSIVLLNANVTSRATSHKLCLQCHASNGGLAGVSHAPQNVIAPKVYSDATWNDDMAFNQIGAGGNFSTELDTNWDTTTPASLGFGHSLGATNVMPPGATDGDAALPYLTCISCHDPHGANTAGNDGNTNLFRNLRVNATGAGQNSGIAFRGTVYTVYCCDWQPGYGTYGYYYAGGKYYYFWTGGFGNGTAEQTRWLFRSYVGGVNGTYFGGSETDNAGQVIWPVYRGNLTADPVTDTPNSNSYPNQNNVDMSRWCS